ncbi:rho GTPase-activating protein Graf isoform X3 [Drosophila sulfurigaster albostrigata]|uniref:rho GTPase-activating protein Graf isoform X3 n=1 Tax=Drosophila sulfurigaster albostrigata TaxID=89887 RepID=UPI002D21AC37|nr:rho GTPase-activating protein Graf isoform X3 [Drosophila sulfurigaster albostrigata]
MKQTQHKINNNYNNNNNINNINYNTTTNEPQSANTNKKKCNYNATAAATTTATAATNNNYNNTTATTTTATGIATTAAAAKSKLKNKHIYFVRRRFRRNSSNNNNNQNNNNNNNNNINNNNNHKIKHKTNFSSAATTKTIPTTNTAVTAATTTTTAKNGRKAKMGGGKDIRRGLEPLEFEECIVDSPEFRDNLNRHEKELDHTSHQIKRIIKEVKDLMSAAKVLSTRMKQLAILLNDFNFECIGTAQTDDENVICESLKRFGAIIGTIEDEREKMLTLADKHIIESLEDFRKKQIGGVKENKKKFDKKTEKFCQSQERFLNMSTKKPENTIQEADASLGMHEREYIQESLSYVLRIQEVQERIKFEFVEILLAFISGWLVFYHTAHEQAEDHRDYLQDLRHKVQKTRENFEEAREKVTELKTKYMEKRTKSEEIFTKRGYLFLMEKSSLLKISLLEPFKATWTKYYCTFKKQKREFTMLQFNQMNHSFTRPEAREDEKLTLFSCQRRASEFEKRFCFDLTFKEKPGIVYTFQALSEKDHRSWLSAMDGTEPTYLAPGKMKASEAYQLDETGFMFVRRCIQVLEGRGLEDEGIYRKSGVGTKINKLLALGMERKETEDVFTDDKYRDLMESNTIASALKMYLRNLNEPLMTYHYHSGFIEAAKKESLNQRVNEVHKLVYKLPQPNFEMLDMVIRHLTEVSRKYEKNKMSVFNLGVVFGPTLLRPLEETVAAILDIKFNNIVINILIENYERIFKNDPSSAVSASSLPTTAGNLHTSSTSPPTRMPRASQVGKAASTGGGGGGGGGGGNTTNAALQAHHATPATATSRHVAADYLMATATPVAQSASSSHIYTNAGSNRHSLNNVSPPTAAMRKERLLQNSGSSSAIVSGPQQHPPVQRSHFGYGQAKHYSPVAAASTSSSNESVCDSLSSNNGLGGGGVAAGGNGASGGHLTSSGGNGGGGGGGGGGGSNANVTRLLNARSSIDYPPITSQTSSLSTLLGSTCDDIVTATAAPSMIGGAGGMGSLSGSGSTNESADYAPTKMHRNRDIIQIKRDLNAGTARVRTLYACMGESEGELSFEPNQIITNVRFSHEPGWLQGTLNGKTGLIPENYVEHLKPYH